MPASVFLLVLGAGLLEGCRSTASPHLFVVDREVLVRHDEASDRADVLVIHKGVTAGGWPIRPAVDYVERVGRGDTPFLHLPTAIEDSLLATAVLDKPVVFVDPADGLCIAQEAHFSHIRAGIEAWNRRIREWILAAPAEELSDLSENQEAMYETHLAIRNAAASGWQFVRFEGSSFTFEAPLTPAFAELFVKELPADDQLGTLSECAPWMGVAFHLESSSRRIDVEPPASATASPSTNPRTAIWITPHRLTFILGRPEDDWLRVPSAPGVRIVHEPGPAPSLEWRALGFFESMFWGLFRTHVANAYDPGLVRSLEDRGAAIPRNRTTSELRSAFLGIPQESCELPAQDPVLAFVPPWGFFFADHPGRADSELLSVLILPPLFPAASDGNLTIQFFFVE
jgi:hypothetical protein